jgi:hypothetical protein
MYLIPNGHFKGEEYITVTGTAVSGGDYVDAR